MFAFHMTMQVRPTQTGYVAVLIRTIVSKQQNSILEDLILLILDAQIVIGPSKVLFLEILIAAHRIVGKDHKGTFGLDTDTN